VILHTTFNTPDEYQNHAGVLAIYREKVKALDDDEVLHACRLLRRAENVGLQLGKVKKVIRSGHRIKGLREHSEIVEHSKKFHKDVQPKQQGIPAARAVYALFGLCEEVGEVIGKVADHLENGGDFLDLIEDEAILKELGDVAWYLAASSAEFGLCLSTVMAKNLEKLNDRKDRGVLHGEGDNR